MESIHGLHEIYKELSSLVVAQGTILDRIDYNIDRTGDNIKRANSHLEDVHDGVTSGVGTLEESDSSPLHLHSFEHHRSDGRVSNGEV